MGALHAKACIVGNHAFVGSTDWTVASRANNECSLHVLLDDVTAATFHSFIDQVWSAAGVIDRNQLLEKNAERLRIQSLRAIEKAQNSRT